MPSSPGPGHLSSRPVFFDTHAHLTDRAFDPDRDAVIGRAREQRVAHILCVGYDLLSSRGALELARRNPRLYAAVGIHPHDADSWTEKTAQELMTLARHPAVKAIGETGLDYYRTYSRPEHQRRAFEGQIRLARDLDLPLVIHVRNAHREALAILKAEHNGSGVLHCFSGDPGVAREALDLGFYLSFAGSITYNGCALKETIKTAPLDRLLAETDCPYLAPRPERGKRNEPRFVSLVVEEMARSRGMDPGELARITCENGTRCFRIDSPR